MTSQTPTLPTRLTRVPTINLEDCPFKELENNSGFGDKIWVVKDLKTSKHCLIIIQFDTNEELYGIACFSTEALAQKHIKGQRLEPALRQITFEQAHELARSKGLPIVALILADDMKQPLIHYVR